MAFPRKTTLDVDPGIMRRLREEVARQSKTMSALVESGRHSLTGR